MGKYITCHRRGTTEQWSEKNTIIPLEGEIVIEIDEENSLHKLKIGDGKHTYAQLAYLKAGDEIVSQVLSEVKPRIVTVELGENWTQNDEGKYSQVISLTDITSNSRLDLQPDADMLAEFKQLGVIFTTENNNGTITVYSIGNMPLKSYTMQATIVETDCDGQDVVLGIPVGTPIPQSDWNQSDDTKADYIKNKPVIGDIASLSEIAKGNLTSDVQESLNKADSALQSETDPTVPDWAKAANKPTYTAEEVGALPADTDIPSIEGLATESYVDNKVAEMVDSAPDTLNTLNELAQALGDDPNFATTVAKQIGTKVDKEEGKGLSTNDFTDEEKAKLAGIVEGANNVPLYSVTGTNTDGAMTQAAVTENLDNINTKIDRKHIVIGKMPFAKIGYTTFAKLNKVSNSDDMMASMIISAVGDYGGTNPGGGVWLVELNGRQTITMKVTTLSQQSGGTVTFGYYTLSDTEYCFGVLRPAYSQKFDIEILECNWNRYTIADIETSTTMPEGWTAVTPRVLQDATGVRDIASTVVREQSHTHKPSDISLSGYSNKMDPIITAYIGEGRSNKSFGLKPSDIVIEYSRDGGATWIAYGTSDEDKVRLVSETGSYGYRLGNSTDKTQTTNYMLRITLTPSDGRYVYIDSVYHYISTEGNTVVFDMETSDNAGTTFNKVLSDMPLKGWGGPNIHYRGWTWGGWHSWCAKSVRLTYKMTAVDNNYGSAYIRDIRFFGSTLYNAGNDSSQISFSMLKYGTPYEVDNYNQSTNFKGLVTATQGFKGDLQGNADTATKATQDADGNVIADTYISKDKIGAGLSLAEDGTLSATGGGVADAVDWENVQGKPENIVNFIGAVSTISDLPVENNSIGDVYQIQTEGVLNGISEIFSHGDEYLEGDVTISGGFDIVGVNGQGIGIVRVNKKITPIINSPAAIYNPYNKANDYYEQHVIEVYGSTSNYTDVTLNGQGFHTYNRSISFLEIYTGGTYIPADACVMWNGTEWAIHSMPNFEPLKPCGDNTWYAIRGGKYTPIIGENGVGWCGVSLSNYSKLTNENLERFIHIGNGQINGENSILLSTMNEYSDTDLSEPGDVSIECNTPNTFQVNQFPLLDLETGKIHADRIDTTNIDIEIPTPEYATYDEASEKWDLNARQMNVEEYLSSPYLELHDSNFNASITLSADSDGYNNLVMTNGDAFKGTFRTNSGGKITSGPTNSIQIWSSENKTWEGDGILTVGEDKLTYTVNTGIENGEIVGNAYEVYHEGNKPTAEELGITSGVPIINATSTNGKTYLATDDSITELKTGTTIVFIPSRTSTSTEAALDLNGFGAKEIKRTASDGSVYGGIPKPGWLVAELPYTLMYDGDYWVAIDMPQTTLSDVSGRLSIENGGTGADTAENARANLGIIQGIPVVHADVDEYGDYFVESIPGVSELTVGQTICFIPGATSDNTQLYFVIYGPGGINDPQYSHSIKRNVSIGTVRKADGIKADWLYIGRPYLMTFDGTYWILDGLTKPSATDLHSQVPIASGGTGATTAEAARENLGIIQGMPTVLGSTTTYGDFFVESIPGIDDPSNIDAGTTICFIPSTNSQSEYVKLAIGGTADDPTAQYEIKRDLSIGSQGNTGGGTADWLISNRPYLLTFTGIWWKVHGLDKPSAADIAGQVPVANGGTGVSTLASGQALIGNGTGAVTTRAITNNTATTTAISGSTNLVTMNTLRYALNRTTGIGSADTNYDTAMVRAVKASTTDLTAGTSTLTSGQIYLVYE